MRAGRRNTIRIVILFLLLLLPVIYAMLTAVELEYSWTKRIAYLVTALLLLLLPALVLKARTYFVVEGIFNFFFFPIDIASLYLNKQSASVPFLQNIFHTDWHESTELLLAVWPLCLLVVLLWIGYFILAFRVKNESLFGRPARRFIGLAFGVIVLLGVCTMGALQKYLEPSKPTKHVLLDSFDRAWMKLYKIYPYNLYLNTAEILRAQYRLHQTEKQLHSFRFGVQLADPDSTAIYILVLGEASRYDHWSINGYERNTTPHLSQRTNIIRFDSIYSEANLTRYSVPLIVTRATARQPELAHQEKTLPEAFEEAGFQTGFLAMQPPSGITSRMLSAADYSYYNAKDYYSDGNFDAELIDALRRYINDSLQFFVLHSMGSHFRYEQRYPASFEIYQPVLGRAFSSLQMTVENKQQITNAYDNTILYTDWFLDELIALVDSLDRKAVVLYVSDHGESLWDDERNLFLHGSYPIVECEYHVPLFIWYSDEYASSHPEKIDAMRANTGKCLSTDVVFYSLLDIAGIEGECVDVSRSVCRPTLKSADTLWVHTGSGEIGRLNKNTYYDEKR